MGLKLDAKNGKRETVTDPPIHLSIYPKIHDSLTAFPFLKFPETAIFKLPSALP
jgi:hypothetical protein